MKARSIALLLFALSTTGCIRYLRPSPQSVQAFAAEETCGQGPYEIRLDAVGARWQESLWVVAYTPRAIRGHYELYADGERVRLGEFGQRRLVPRRRAPTTERPYEVDFEQVEDPGPDNARCLASAETLASATGQGGLGAPAETPVATTAPEGSPALSPPPTGAAPTEPRLVAVPWEHDEARLYPPEMMELGWSRVEIADLSLRNEDPEELAIAEGAELLLRLWSVAPNDLEEVRFVVEHSIGVPNVGDERWVEHLERRRERDARQAERRRARAARRAERRARRRERRGEPERVTRAPHRHSSPASVAVAPPPPVEPDGPPPPPRADPRPPRPSEGATWIAGYWHWHLGDWLWLAGRWEVPEEDIEQERTATAPEAPPPPQAEAPPPAPAEGMVWTPGYWQWNGAAFVWVGGSWRLPPRSEATWSPPAWQPGRAGVVFVPGRWTLRIGR